MIIDAPVIIAVAVNIAVVAVSWGSMRNEIKNLRESMQKNENKSEKDRDQSEARDVATEARIQGRMNHLQSEMLPDCAMMFGEIKSELKNLNGKVDSLLKKG